MRAIDFLKRSSSTPCVLVCVTDQFSCARLVSAGAEIAKLYGLSLRVISVQCATATPNAQALEHLFNVSRSFGAEMTVFYDADPARNFIKYVRRIPSLHIVAGVSGQVGKSPFYATIEKYNRLRRKHKMLLHVVEKNGEVRTYDAMESVPEQPGDTSEPLRETASASERS